METSYFDRYLRSTTVLALDMLVSALASMCVMVFCSILSSTPELTGQLLMIYLPGSIGATLVAVAVTRIYHIIIRYTSLHEIGRLCLAVLLKEVLLGVVMAAFPAHGLSVVMTLVLLAIDFVATLGCLLVLYALMYWVYSLVSMFREKLPETLQRVLVYGVGEKPVALVTRLRKSTHYEVVGFLTYAPKSIEHTMVSGLRVRHFQTADDVVRIAREIRLNGILFAHPNDVRLEKDRLLRLCQETGLKLFVAPGIDEMTDGKVPGAIRKIRIEDLLGREEIKISMDLIRENVAGKVVLVTGAAGSIGSELCRQLAGLGVAKLVMLDNAETPLHNVRLEFEDRYPGLKFVPVVGDVRSLERLDYVFTHWKPQVVFHAAAYKHVPLMEDNPCEAVLVNVIGSRNVANMCLRHGAEKMVMVSTDKAVNPTNIMGCTKRLAEIYVQALGLAVDRGEREGRTTFVTTRFGNVLGSNGSVIPRFTEQIEKGGPVTVTDPEIRRYFMTIPEACRLVMEAATMSDETRIFVFDMGSPVKIADLARRMIILAGYEPDKDIAIQYTGLRPGEKLYEEVLATKENTVPTDHARIFVAKVRDYKLADAEAVVNRLEQLSRAVQIPDMVILMKATVPEFKSKHSKFEIYDKSDATDNTDA